MTRRRLWIALGAVAAAGLIAVLAVPRLADVNRYRGLIESKVEQALGREVRLGELHLSWLPLGVRVDGLAIGALAGEGGGDLLTAEHLRVGARLLPLLRKRLEVTAIVVEGPVMTLERRADSSWNVERWFAEEEEEDAPETAPSGSGDFRVLDLHLTGGRITVRDLSLGRERPVELVLGGLDLRVRDLSLDRPVEIDLAAAIEPEGAATVGFSGKVGPFRTAVGEPLRVLGRIDLKKIDATHLGLLAPGLIPPGLLGAQGFSVAAEIEAALGETKDLRGSLALSGAEVHFAAPDGARRAETLDVDVRYDVGVSDGGSTLTLRTLDLVVWKNTLQLRGTVLRKDGTSHVDLELLPAKIPADDLAALWALAAGELPFSFASEAPIELALKARGPVAPGVTPSLEGSLKLTDFTFRHPAMSEPLERLTATVDLRGDQVAVRGLSAVIGSSDLAGSISVHGFDGPAVGFDLVAQRADFGELFSLVATEKSATPGGPAAPAARPRLTVDGKLRIGSGSFKTLDFDDLQATIGLAGGVLTLAPVGARLYSGTFEGKITTDLGQDPPPFEVRGDARGVDLDRFLQDNLDSAGLLAGRFTGKIETRGRGVDFESIVRSLSGSGFMEVREGRVGRLDVLKTLAKVSGLFGETTVEQLSGKLAAEGTEFSELESKLKLGQGRMQLQELSLDSPDFRIEGAGDVDLLTALLEGEFRLTLSEAISASMRGEESKAGRLFWNAKTKRVELPFKLSGPFDAPSASIDFESVARAAAKDTIEGEVQKRILDRLGVKPQPSESKPPPAAGAKVAPDAAPTLTSEWGDSLLARDLEIEGSLKAQEIASAELTVTDAKGRQVARVPIRQVEQYLALGKPQSRLSWRVKIDGKKLVLAQMPLTLRIVSKYGDGTTAEATREVDR